MSYILDALKRADAERERGHVPGLHSQSVRPGAAAASSPVRRLPAWRWMAGLATAVTVLVAGAWWMGKFGSQDGPVAPQQSSPAPAPLPVAPAPEPAIRETAPEAQPAAPPLLQPEPLPPLLKPVPASPPVVKRPVATPAELAAAASKTTPVRRLSDLPPAQRAQIPSLKLSGATYSENPAHRMLIVNGAVLQEGQEPAPGLRLEHIGPHEAVFSHRGERFSVGY